MTGGCQGFSIFDFGRKRFVKLLAHRAGLTGKEGRPVFIAFQGKVYDVTKSPLWGNGLHMNRHPSGKDLAGDISAAPHGTEVFERYPMVGTLKKGPPEELKNLPP